MQTQKQRLLGVWMCITIGALLSCSDDSPTGPGSAPDPGEIKPLAVGNQWTYSYAILDTLGDTLFAADYTFYVHRDTIIGDELWYILGRENSHFTLETIRASGLWERYYRETYNLLIKYPTYRGDGYDSSPSIVGNEFQFNVVVSSVNEKITVSDGTYWCICYLFFDANTGLNVWADYYSPGTGLVKKEIRNSYTLDGVPVTKYLELTSKVIQ